jgi:hypothetical protein
MSDDRYRWIGQLKGTPAQDYAVPSNWFDTTTGQVATRVPGPGDVASFDAVPADTGTVEVLAPQAADTLFVIDGSTLTFQGFSGPAPETLDSAQTLSVGTVYLGTAGPVDFGMISTDGVVLDVAHNLIMRDSTLENPPGVPGGIVIGDPTYTPHGEVHIGAQGFLLATGGSVIANLNDDGGMQITEGPIAIANIGGGLSGSGSIDVQGSPSPDFFGAGTLDLSHAGYADPTTINTIGTLHLEQYSAELILGTNSLGITGDYINDNTGIGNAYDPRAGVIGGEVLGNGAHIALGGDAKLVGNDAYTLDLGSFHVGDTLSASYMVENSGTSGAAALRGAIQNATNGGTIIDPGLSGSGVMAQNFGPIAAGGTSDAYQVTLNADRAGQGEFARLNLPTDFSDSGTATLDVVGTAYNYAVPVFETLAGSATLSHNGNAWTLDLGTLAKGSNDTVEVGVTNGASGLADLLSGSFDVAGGGFLVSGATPFSDLPNDGSIGATLDIAADTAQTGQHSETAVLHPTGSNASGYSAALPDQTLTITDTVTQPPFNLQDLLHTVGQDVGSIVSQVGGAVEHVVEQVGTVLGGIHFSLGHQG